jgi:predicted RNA-binding protein YlxR (DUF448 family)
MIRVAKGPDGVAAVDPRPAEGEAAGAAGRARRLPGRGAYLCPKESCLAGALTSGRLARTLRLPGPPPEEVVAGLARRIAATSETRESEDERGSDG